MNNILERMNKPESIPAGTISEETTITDIFDYYELECPDTALVMDCNLEEVLLMLSETGLTENEIINLINNRSIYNSSINILYVSDMDLYVAEIFILRHDKSYK